MSIRSLDQARLNEEENDEDEAEEDQDNYQEIQDNEIIQRVENNEQKEKYKDIGPAHAWCERQFYGNDPNLSIKNPSFWYGLAKHHVENRQSGDIFIHPDFCLNPFTTINEVLLMLSVLEAPFNLRTPHVYKFLRDIGELSIVPSCDCIIFHEQVKPCLVESINSGIQNQPILIGQSIFDLEEMDTMLQIQKEKEPVEIISRRLYISRVVVTNISSIKQKVKLLFQVPEGSISLNGVSSEAKSIEIAPFTTLQYQSPIFYFPYYGSYQWFPSHVSTSNKLLAFAQPRTLTVVSSQTFIDEESWAHIVGKSAKIEQVIQFLEHQNLQEISNDIQKLLWRFSLQQQEGKFDWEKVMETLELRREFVKEIAVFSLVYDEKITDRVKDALFAYFHDQVGPKFSSPLLSYDLNSSLMIGTNQKLSTLKRYPEVYPFINARAHKQTNADMRISTNAKISKNHTDIIEELCYYDKPISLEMRVRLIILLINENRIEDARKVFSQIEEENIFYSDRMQLDYLRIYLAFFIDDSYSQEELYELAQDGLDFAKKYESYPNLNWRNRFVRVTQYCQDILQSRPYSTMVIPTSPSQSRDKDLANSPMQSQRKSSIFTTEHKFLSKSFQSSNRDLASCAPSY